MMANGHEKSAGGRPQTKKRHLPEPARPSKRHRKRNRNRIRKFSGIVSPTNVIQSTKATSTPCQSKDEGWSRDSDKDERDACVDHVALLGSEKIEEYVQADLLRALHLDLVYTRLANRSSVAAGPDVGGPRGNRCRNCMQAATNDNSMFVTCHKSEGKDCFHCSKKTPGKCHPLPNIDHILNTRDAFEEAEDALKKADPKTIEGLYYNWDIAGREYVKAMRGRQVDLGGEKDLEDKRLGVDLEAEPPTRAERIASTLANNNRSTHAVSRFPVSSSSVPTTSGTSNVAHVQKLGNEVLGLRNEMGEIQRTLERLQDDFGEFRRVILTTLSVVAPKGEDGK